MSRATQRAWGAVGIGALLAACGGSTVVDPGGSGGTGTGTGNGAGGTGATGAGGGTAGAGALCGLGTVGAQPPPPAANPSGPVHGSATFAISQIFPGDRDWNNVASISAWQQFGFNLDNRISTASSTDLCQPADGAAPTKVYPDGNSGIDNSFGKNLMPIFVGLSPDWSMEMNALIAAGDRTVLLEVVGLGEGPAYSDLQGTSWRGARLGSPPSFDGNDTWPPYVGTDGAFSCGYAAGHQVVLTQGEVLELTINFVGDIPWILKLHHPIVSMQLADDHRTVTQGLVAGIIRTEELADDFRSIAGYFDPSLCEGSTVESIVSQFRQASDIMSDGSQNPGAVCDGISAGFGFRGSLVYLGGAEGQPPPPPDPCGPQPGSG